MKKNPSAFYVRAPDVPPRQATADETSGLPADRMGVPIFWYWRAMLEPRRYSHPSLGELKFSQGELSEADRWTNEMIADGSKPYLPVGHKGKDANQGFIWRTKYDGQYLHGLHGFVGESARERAAQNETSVCLRRNWKGGNGKVYPIVVEHNALVPDAVAMNLPDYVALSRDASGLPDEVLPVFSPAAERISDMTQDQLAMARDVLGQPELPEDQAVALLIEAASTASRYAGEAEEATVQLSRTAEELAEARTKLATQIVEMSRATTPQRPSASELHWASKYVASQREAAVRSGAITPAIADKAEARFLSAKPVKFETITLSREVQDDDHKLADGFARLLDFYETVQGNVPTPKTGEQTGPQNLIPMARGEPGTGDAPAADLPFKRMAETYNAKAADAK